MTRSDASKEEEEEEEANLEEIPAQEDDKPITNDAASEEGDGALSLEELEKIVEKRLSHSASVDVDELLACHENASALLEAKIVLERRTRSIRSGGSGGGTTKTEKKEGEKKRKEKGQEEEEEVRAPLVVVADAAVEAPQEWKEKGQEEEVHDAPLVVVADTAVEAPRLEVVPVAPPRRHHHHYEEPPGAYAVGGTGRDLRTMDNVAPPEATAETPPDYAQEESDVEMAIANEVRGDRLRADIPVATEFHGGAETTQRQHPRNKRQTAGYAVWCIMAVGLAVTLVLVFTSRQERESQTSSTVTKEEGGSSTLGAPTDSPSAVDSAASAEEYLRLALYGSSSTAPQQLDNADSPQSRAFHWILEDPHLYNYGATQRIVQRYAVAVLYFALGGDTWYNRTKWLDHGVHECDWFFQEFIGIDEDWILSKRIEDLERYRLVTNPCSSSSSSSSSNTTGSDVDGEPSFREFQHLWLDNNGLEGTLPLELYSLTALQSISIMGNSIEGTISSSVQQLKDLEFFQFSSNKIGGSLPPEIWNQMSKLTSLNVYNNKLSGSFPTEIGYMTHLRDLVMDENQYFGTIPTEVGLLANARSIYLDHNRFTGTLPSEFGLLTDIVFLAFHDNYGFNGTIATEFGNLKKVEYLYFDENPLTGTIPSELGMLTDLIRLHIYETKMEGTFPTELGNLERLRRFIFRINGLTGTIPTELGRLTEMESVDVWGNQLTGTIPTQLGMWSMMCTWLDLGTNLLSGAVPSEFGNLPVRQLFFENNQLSGMLPSQIGRLSNLTDTYIGGNAFTGLMPTEIWTLSSLIFFGFRGNQMEPATLPSELGRWSNLRGLLANNAGLIGEIPSELGLLTELEQLRLHENDLTGTIPPELSGLPLEFLTVNGTSMMGWISEDLCGVKELVFDCGVDNLCGCDCPCNGTIANDTSWAAAPTTSNGTSGLH